MRRQHGGGRPEELHPDSAAAYFDETSQSYAASSSLQATQLALTSRCVDMLLRLPPTPAASPRLVLDVGCGCGFSSTKALQELQRHTQTAGAAHVLGFDLSFEMLRNRRQPDRNSLICADMARMPFRPGKLFDAVISVSVLQWLASHTELLAFFHQLRRSCALHARAVLQFYPSSSEHAALAAPAAREAGWGTARLLCCFPEKKARKWFLCVGPADDGDGEATRQRMCPLAWPYAATCALCWGWDGEAARCRRPVCVPQVRSGGVGSGAAGAHAARSDPAGPGDDGSHHEMEWNVTLIEEHVRLGCQLLRVWSRLRQGLPTRPSVSERALLELGLGDSLAAAVGAQALSGTQGDLKEKLRHVWWNGAADAMHPIGGSWRAR